MIYILNDAEIFAESYTEDFKIQFWLPKYIESPAETTCYKLESYRPLSEEIEQYLVFEEHNSLDHEKFDTTCVVPDETIQQLPLYSEEYSIIEKSTYIVIYNLGSF
jgi:hypothetical protein